MLSYTDRCQRDVLSGLYGFILHVREPHDEIKIQHTVSTTACWRRKVQCRDSELATYPRTTLNMSLYFHWSALTQDEESLESPARRLEEWNRENKLGCNSKVIDWFFFTQPKTTACNQRSLSDFSASILSETKPLVKHSRHQEEVTAYSLPKQFHTLCSDIMNKLENIKLVEVNS